ncbi:pentapeptide repeat-containing protein [Nannocystis radixulma]|uniref:Pentapeptide repeat-containing protein n=1 Tax=Nannocystis radixulma TaxID=2995305 RepID=A0ABT5B1A2_9BACT|nr:pentapeptide repeat-containing protein [Nannocystis radixulma]MDC0667875.1 pentapeptide repeat-containing protein [Nannocystis radixulma]
MANAITRWQFTVPSLNGQQATNYAYEYGYAGGLLIVGLGADGMTYYDIYDQGGGVIALGTNVSGPEGTYTQYWNSHFDNAMALWDDTDGYNSNSIGPEQLFKLVHIGGTSVAFQAAGGASQGQYLYGSPGGWYPVNWSFGESSICIDSSSTSPGSAQTFTVVGDVLPILVITGSGVQLDLSGRNLAGVNLTNADMTQATLSGADLSQVTGMSGTIFKQAVLRGTIFTGQSLSAATFEQADFTGTSLTAIAASPNTDFTGANFTGADLSGLNLAGAKLVGATLAQTNLTNTDLSGADLTNAVITGATLTNTNLQGAVLQGTQFVDCDLSGARFDAAPNFSRVSPAARTAFPGSTVPYAVITNNWQYLDLTGASITGIPKAIVGFVADAAIFPVGLDLGGKTLLKASLVGTQMVRAQFQGTDLQGATMTSAVLEQADLTGANLTLADLSNAILVADQGKGPNLSTAAKLTNAFLIDATLAGAYCDGVDFSGCTFLSYSALTPGGTANAKGARIDSAKFNDAILVQAVFDGAEGAGANFSGATLVAASFVGAQLPPTDEAPHAAASFYNADIRGLDGQGSNMDQIDLQGALQSTTDGGFTQTYKDFYGNPVPIGLRYGPTVLGTTSAVRRSSRRPRPDKRARLDR